MCVLLLRKKANAHEVQQMLKTFGTYIKVAVDIESGLVAGGGVWHADAERVLEEAGSDSSDIWGGDYIPSTREVRYESLINISPAKGNRSLEIKDSAIRRSFEKRLREVFENG